MILHMEEKYKHKLLERVIVDLEKNSFLGGKALYKKGIFKYLIA